MLVYGAQAAAQNDLAQWWAKQMQQPAYRAAWDGLYIYDLSREKEILDVHGGRLLAPASVMKLLTTATAWQLLGPDFRYETRIYAVGTVNARVLNGYLMIAPSGDPTLGSRYFEETAPGLFWQAMTEAIRQQGIDSVAQGVCLLETDFDPNVTPDGWIWEDLGNYYAAPAFDLNWRDNTLYAYFSPGRAPGEPALLRKVEPALPFAVEAWTNQVTTGKAGSGDQVYADRAAYQVQGFLRGTYPMDGTFPVKLMMHYPAVYFLQEMGEHLRAGGVRCSPLPEPCRVALPKESRLLWVHRSPRLEDIIRETNRRSINLFAEGLYKTLAVRMGAHTPHNDAAEVIKSFWRGQGVVLDQARILDGSGLSPANALTPRMIVALLRVMAGMPHAASFRNTLAQAGSSGTLRWFGRGTALAGRVWAKTGSMRDVVSLAGYYHSASGRHYAFAFMLNKADASYTEVMQLYARLLLQLP